MVFPAVMESMAGEQGNASRTRPGTRFALMSKRSKGHQKQPTKRNANILTVNSHVAGCHNLL